LFKEENDMTLKTAIVEIGKKYKVYTEHYLNATADKTIILVNGSLATTASFAQTVRYLRPRFNVVLYDQPYAGQSKQHNLHDQPIRKEDEAAILLELIEHFRAQHVMSFSWGGAATLLALAQHPRRIEKAVISSFAARINTPMRDYLESGRDFLQACDRRNVGRLINSTIGKHLPSLFKRFNERHVSSLDEHEYRCCLSTANGMSTPRWKTPVCSQLIPVRRSFRPSRTPGTSSIWNTRRPGMTPSRLCWAFCNRSPKYRASPAIWLSVAKRQ
jgi:pimeloyl-ACP methyl ester carboxylesterase